MSESYTSFAQTQGTRLYSDFDLSFKSKPLSGDLNMKYDGDAVKQSIKNIIFTLFSERPFQPLFGCGIYDLLFQQLDSITKSELDFSIRNALRNYEPRAQIVSLDINSSNNNDGIDISLQFNIINSTNTETMKIFVSRIR